METSSFESIDCSAEVTGLGCHDATARNAVNFDTAGYIGAPEVVAKVAEVADAVSGWTELVSCVAGGETSSIVDYGNSETTCDLEIGELYI